jgi:hypothetical protein
VETAVHRGHACGRCTRAQWRAGPTFSDAQHARLAPEERQWGGLLLFMCGVLGQRTWLVVAWWARRWRTWDGDAHRGGQVWGESNGSPTNLKQLQLHKKKLKLYSFSFFNGSILTWTFYCLVYVSKFDALGYVFTKKFITNLIILLKIKILL